MLLWRILKQIAMCFTTVLIVFSSLPAHAASAPPARGNTHTMSSSFSAVDLSKGFYSGIELGEASNNYGTGLAVASRSVVIGGVTTPFVVSPLSGEVSTEDTYARLFMGWLFHVNVAVELGVMQISRIKIDKLVFVMGAAPQKAKVDFGAVDLALKLVLPVSDQIRFFTRLGLYYMRLASDDKVMITSVGGTPIPVPQQRFKILKGGEDELSWLIGVGVIFALSELMECYFAWTHYSGNGITSFTKSTSTVFQDIDAMGLGFIYKTT